MVQFTTGTHIMVVPPHEECAGWRAILAGFNPDGSAVVIPVEGFYGKLDPRSIDLSRGANGPGICLSGDIRAIRDKQQRGERVYCGTIDGDLDAAESLATAIAHACNLDSKD